MTKIGWSDTYSVGSAALDQDHKGLIDIINRVEEAESAGRPVQWALQDLEQYAREHFSREEAAMREADYPEFDDHLASHKSFVEWLGTVRRTLSMDPEAEFHLAGTVKAYLKDWLIGHILSVDMKYKEYLP